MVTTIKCAACRWDYHYLLQICFLEAKFRSWNVNIIFLVSQDWLPWIGVRLPSALHHWNTPQEHGCFLPTHFDWMTTCGFSVPSKVQILYLHLEPFPHFPKILGGQHLWGVGNQDSRWTVDIWSPLLWNLYIWGFYWRYNPLILTHPTGHSSGQVCCGVIYQVIEYIDIHNHMYIYYVYSYTVYIFSIKQRGSELKGRIISSISSCSKSWKKWSSSSPWISCRWTANMLSKNTHNCQPQTVLSNFYWNKKMMNWWIYLDVKIHPCSFNWKELASWWFQPLWKILVEMGSSSPSSDENKKYLKPPTRLVKYRGF